MEYKILTLCGNLFKVSKEFKFCSKPNIIGTYSFNSDIFTGVYFTLIKTPEGKYYYIKYNLELQLYIQRELFLIEHQDQSDIKKYSKWRQQKKK